MKYFRAGIIFRPDKTDSHLKAKPFVKFGKVKTGISGKAKDQTPRSERVKLRLAGTTERAVAKTIEKSGNRFVVKDRDGHPRGWYPTAEEAEAKAGDDGTVFDRIEGRNINRKKRDYDIPDPGVEDAPESWTVGS